MREVRPLVVVLTLRPLAEPTEDYSALIEAAGDKERSASGGLIPLQGLAAPDVSRLLRDHLSVDDIPQALLELIME